MLATCAILAAACATAGAPGPEPKPFEHVGKVALVRWSERRAEQRAKDPLDGLSESLAARGIATRAIEVGPRGADTTAARERLWAEVEGYVRAATPYEARGTTPRPLGSEAGLAVQDLGVDAAVIYLRLDRSRTLPPAARPPSEPPEPFTPPPSAAAQYESRYRPVAALALIGRGGGLVWFDWGPRDEGVDPPGPVNAAEALDQVVRLLTGEPPTEEE